jgi:drug/metabolite transporter superfamily protein YnfA
MDTAAGDEPGALRALNAKLKILTAAVSIPGSLAGGFLVASLGIPGALSLYAAANLLVLAPLYLWLFPRGAGVPVEPRDQPAPKAGEAAGLWDAVKLVVTSRVLIGALAAMAAGVALVEPLRSTTLPILASGLAPATAAVLLGGFQAAFYVGQFAGNFALLKWSKRLSDRGWLLVGSIGLAAFSLFMAAAVHVAFGFAAAALVGVFSQPMSVVAKTLFQEEVRRLRPDLLGRAMGVNNIFYRLSVSAGTALVGWAAVSGTALAFGATGTLALVYGGLGVALVAAVLWLLKRPAPPSDGGATKLHGAAFAGPLLAFSALDWHMTLGAFTGFVILWMATTGAITIAGPLLKKKLEPHLPPAPSQEGFAAHTLSLAQAEAALAAARPGFRPVSALARRGAGRAWYEFENGYGALAAVDGRSGAPVEPFISPAEARAAFERWLAGSEWSVASEPVLLTAYDEQYRKGEVPVYRVRLKGRGDFDAFVSARDGRPVEALSRLSRVIRWAGIGMHTFGFGLLKSKYDSVRRVAMPLFVALPIILTVLFAMLWRFL